MDVTQSRQQYSTNKRVLWFQIAVAAVFMLLQLSFWEIQVSDNSRYRLQAEQNRIKTLPVPAARGNILDRYGRVIAYSRFLYSAILDPAGTRAESLPAIVDGLGLDLETLLEQVREASEYGTASQIVLKENLSNSDLAFLQARRREFPEVGLIEGMGRRYPEAAVAVHALGYVGKASKRDLNLHEFLLYDFGAEIGKTGIERQYDRWLRGDNGQLMILSDSLGRQLDIVGVEQSVPGRDLRLTLDLDLQAVAELGIEGRRGAVVALDPRNGEILAMASAPAYDPNKFVTGITGSEWEALNSDPATPLLNRAIQGTWAMGSVFKPIVALGGLEQEIAVSDFTAYCAGGLAYGGAYFRCHKRDGHGRVGLHRAIAQSCDVYFYQLGSKLGIANLARYARLAGLGSKTAVDLPEEVPGLVPSEAWKVRQFGLPWNPGETVVVSIGQGAMSVTPIQAAHSIGGLAMDGVWHQPHIVGRRQLEAVAPDLEIPEPRTKEIDPRHRQIIRNAMWEVVNGSGTGRQARLPGIEVCGKTGTSQRVSNETRLRSGRADFEDDAWFVGYAPCHNPEIVVAALIENGKASYYAAAVARDVLQAWLLNRGRTPDDRPDGTLALARQGRG